MSKQMLSPSKSQSGSGELTDTATSQPAAMEGSVTLKYPMPSKSNYPAWVMKMKANMRAQGVWAAVKATDDGELVDEKKDQIALTVIYQAIPEETMLQLAGKKTTREA